MNNYSNPNKFLRFCADVELMCEDEDKPLMKDERKTPRYLKVSICSSGIHL